MAFFLKKTKLNGRTYLSIVESFYSHDKKGTAHRTYKSLSSVETLLASGIEDPIAYCQKEVDRLNAEREKKSEKLISEISPKRYLGYFPLKAVMEKLSIQKYVNYFRLNTSFSFDLYEVLSSLIYARAVFPCSKQKTFHDVLPCLLEPVSFTYSQLLEGLAYIGNNYEKFTELFTMQVQKNYPIKTDTTYFDCTNFYFEIDREDDWKKRGPSKEGRKDPILGLGLLLDANQIPIGMKIYPGNESEKPVMRHVIQELREQNHIQGRTIHVADKGLNCINNILFSLKNRDGYLFSKSVKSLSAIEQQWVLREEGFRDVKDSSGNVLYRLKSVVDDFDYTVTDPLGKKQTVTLKEKRVVTYNPDLARKKVFEIRKLEEKAKDLCLSKAKKSEYGECSKYVRFQGKTTGEDVRGVLNRDAIDRDLAIAGYNMLVTSETKMSDADIYSTYHNLWRIEESFRIMKSDLDARPVYVQKEETIKGHFLICYLTVLLERIWQFHVLHNQYSSESIYSFMKDLQLVKSEQGYVNITSANHFIRSIHSLTGLPIMNYYLSETQLKKVLNYKL